MKYTSLITVLTLASVLQGCHDSHYYHSQNDPEIRSLVLYDSLGQDSRRHTSSELTIDPVLDDGYFELDWSIDTWGDYDIDIFINDHPSPHGATRIISRSCHLGSNCQDEGGAWCRFSITTNADELSCYFKGSVREERKDITRLFSAHPDRLYVGIRVCDDFDTDNCDWSTIGAMFE